MQTPGEAQPVVPEELAGDAVGVAASAVGLMTALAARRNRAWSSRASTTQTSVPSSRWTLVASICHRSLGTSRSKRFVALGRLLGWSVTRWLRRKHLVDGGDG